MNFKVPGRLRREILAVDLCLKQQMSFNDSIHVGKQDYSPLLSTQRNTPRSGLGTGFTKPLCPITRYRQI